MKIRKLERSGYEIEKEFEIPTIRQKRSTNYQKAIRNPKDFKKV